MTETPPKSNATLIYQTIVDLANVNRVASRPVISQITGLKMSIVDDHVKHLRDVGKIRLVVNGVFEPAWPETQDRAVSITLMSEPKLRQVRVELGELCEDLSLREARALGVALAGLSILFGK